MPNFIVRPDLGGDSGQISAFRPATQQKPPSLIRRFVQAFERFRNPVDIEATTQQGTPGASSPLTYQQTLWAQRFERLAMIGDCNEIYLEDARIKASVDMYVREAVRGGYQIKVDPKGALSKRAQALADEMPALTPADTLEDWGCGLLKEGDLFVQAVLAGRDLIKLVAMPAASMERLSDDADEIIDPEKAFEQVDTVSWQTIAQFSDQLMTQVRWKRRTGNRYGTPELVASRRPWRILKLIEESTATRAMVRAPMRLHHKIGDPKNGSAGSEQDIKNYKADNGWISGKNEPFNPLLVALDWFSNGNASIEVLEGDPHLDKIGFIKYMQNVLVSNLPTPLVLVGLDAEAVNRDVVEDVRAEWLKSTTRLNEAIDQVIRFGFEIRLMLRGIDPALVSYSVEWTTSNIEKPSDQITSIIETYREGLLSKKTALTRLQQFGGYDDVEAELAAIEKEQEDKHERALALKGGTSDEDGLTRIDTKKKAKELARTNGNGKHS